MDECLRGWNQTLLDKTPPYQSGGTTRRARSQSQQISRRGKPTRPSDHDADHGYEHDDDGIPHQGYNGNHHQGHAPGPEASGNPRNPTGNSTEDPAASRATLRNPPFNWTDSAAIYAGAGAIAYLAAANVSGGHHMPRVAAWQSHSGAEIPVDPRNYQLGIHPRHSMSKITAIQ